MTVAASKALRVLLLTDEAVVPDKPRRQLEGRDAELSKTEYDVLAALKKLGHEVTCAGVGSDLSVIGHAIDDMQHGITEQKVFFHAGRLLIIAALSAVFLYICRQVIIGASREIEFDLRNDIFANLERQSASYYHTHRTGDIMARTTNDLNAVRMLLGPAIMYSANTIVFTAAALPFMYRISPKLTFFAFVPLPMASILVQYFGARIHRRFERIQAMFSDISAKAQENFSGARLIRAFAQEDAEIASFETANLEYIKRSLYLVRLMAMLWPRAVTLRSRSRK